tara:strand:+ start:979 stop:1242 length:264 start_codon:yes stop_codon:yes gene_type:complete
MTEQEKDDMIKKLIYEIEEKEKSFLEGNIKWIKTLNPDISDEISKEKAIEFGDIMKSASKQMQEDQTSLDLCETMDDVQAWRLKTGI